MSQSLLKTYLYKNEAAFAFVSTIHRESSAAIIPAQWFYETLAWEVDAKLNRGAIIDDNSGATDVIGAISQHAETCRKLIAKDTP